MGSNGHRPPPPDVTAAVHRLAYFAAKVTTALTDNNPGDKADDVLQVTKANARVTTTCIELAVAIWPDQSAFARDLELVSRFHPLPKKDPS